jgi:hypothetical protein
VIAALFIEEGGVYCGLPNVQPWGVRRDARSYRGPFSVVAHPPCQRWGRYAENHPIKGRIARVGEDGGCFAAALTAVRNYGGVLEHPKDSQAWEYFGLTRPTSHGWTRADNFGGWTCQVEQGHYGHFSRKATWLYAVADKLPALRWGRSPQRIHPRALELHGYAKARRIGWMAMIGGKDKTRIREATPIPFRDLLLGIAENVSANKLAA